MTSTSGRWAVAIAVVVLGWAHPASAGLPAWAKAVAEAAPPVPEGVPEWPERTLLAETAIVVSQDGSTWRVSRHKVIQVLSNRVADWSFGSFAFDDTTKIKKSKGWHVPPGERAQRNVGGAVDLTLPNDFLTDAKARVVALDGVKKGSLVVYEFEAESHPYTLTGVESFYDDVPVAVARWSIELPPSWTLKYAWLPGKGPEPSRSGTTWTFEQRDLVPQRDEDFGESPSDLGPRLVVALQPGDGGATTTPAFSDWNDLGRWYQQLAQGREAATPELQSAIMDLLAKTGPAPLDRVRAVTLYVRDRVRYLAREVGIGGYRPRPASQVFSELYGDCKDKGTLLRAGLQVAGFHAYPVLIHASNPYTVAPDVAVPGSFNHFVIGVVWPKDAPFPDEAAGAWVDAGDAGTLLIVDPTDERAWPGTLPDNLAGKTALVVVGSRGVLLTLPESQPAWHLIARTATVAIAADGSVTARHVTRMYGGPAEQARRATAVSFKDRRESVENELRRVWAGVEIKDYAVTPEDADGAFVETVSLAIPAGASALQEHVYWMFAGATGDMARIPLGKRTSAVVYPYPLTLRYETAVTGASKSSEPPSPQKIAGAGWSVQSTFQKDGDAIRGVWTAELSTVRFEPAAFADLKQFWSAASKAAAPGLRLSD